MKSIGAGIILLLGLGAAQAADKSDHGIRGDLRALCNPVCEIRAQDQAFALLIESFRQFRCYQIETDYQQRIAQCESMKEGTGSLIIESSSKGIRTLQQFVFSLAKQERDLKLAQVETECINFQSAYGCARRGDEKFVGQKIPSAYNREAASATLKEFCLVTAGPLAAGNIRTAPCSPAVTVLCDPPATAPHPSQLIESCD